MKLIQGPVFRCDLCGTFSTVGVSEKNPKLPTKICRGCVKQAAELLGYKPKDDR